MNENENYWTRVAARRLSRRKIFGLAGSGVVAAYLTACGGGSSSSGTKTAKSGSSPSSSATAGTAVAGASSTPAPINVGKRGGSLSYGFGLAPGTLDAAIPVSGGDIPFLNMFYDGLLRIRHYVVDTDLSLAQSYQIPDPMTIVFNLRQGVKFHDGTPFNSQAVKWNFDRVQNPATKSVGASFLSTLDHIETPDDNTAKFVLKSPNAALLNNISTIYGLGIVSPTASDKLGKGLASNPVGTGPFTFKEYATGSHVTGTRNPDYWMKDSAGTSLPYLDQFTIQIIPDQTVLYANLQTGSIDMGGINFKDLKSAQSNSSLVVQPGTPGGGVPSVWVFNLDLAPMNDLNFRKAVAYALQPEAVGHAVYFDYGKPDLAGMVTPGSWAYEPIPTRPSYNVAEAKKYLAASSHPDGLSLDLLTYTDPTLAQTTAIYQQNLKAIGIDAKITTQDVSTSTSSFFIKNQFSVFSTEWGGTSFEPDGICEVAYRSSAFYNPMKKPAVPNLDSLIDKGLQTYDLAQRKDIYKQIETATLEQVYFVPQVLVTYPGIFRKNVGNGQTYIDWGFEPRFLFAQ